MQRTEDVDHRARHPPETEPNEASRRGPNDKKKGEQPGINVAAASDDAHETIKWSEVIQISTNSSLNGLFGHAFQPIESKESEENYVSVTNLTGGMRMIRERHPPRRLNKIIEVVLPLSKFGRLRFQTCELAINAIENSINQGEQRSRPKIPAGIKQRHAQTENCRSKRDLIRSDRRSTEIPNEPLLNRCVQKRRKIKDTFLGRVTQQTFGQRTALERRSWKRKTGRTLLRMLPTYAGCGAASTHAMRPRLFRIRSNLFHEYASAISPRKPFAREQSPCTQKLCSRANGFRGKIALAYSWKRLLRIRMAGRIARVDAARQQAYVRSMRRSVRPVFFPAPSLERRPLAERLLRDATQKGVLDFPALVHAPIEKWLVSHLCRTTITPNQITLGTAVLGLGVTLLYACGYLWAGVLLALVIGVLDGIDGKLARLKAQTTKLGKKRARPRLFC